MVRYIFSYIYFIVICSCEVFAYCMTEGSILIIEVCLVRTININTRSPGHKLYRLHVGSGLIIHWYRPRVREWKYNAAG